MKDMAKLDKLADFVIRNYPEEMKTGEHPVDIVIRMLTKHENGEDN